MNTDRELFDEIYQSMEQEESNTANLKEIAGKTILGYACKGYETTTDEGTTRVWVTNDAPVSFVGALMTSNKKLSGTMLNFNNRTMVMELEHIPAKGKKDKFHMICTDLGKENLKINKSDYQSIGGF